MDGELRRPLEHTLALLFAAETALADAAAIGGLFGVRGSETEPDF